MATLGVLLSKASADRDPIQYVWNGAASSTCRDLALPLVLVRTDVHILTDHKSLTYLPDQFQQLQHQINSSNSVYVGVRYGHLLC